MAHHPTYTPAQLETYLERIGYVPTTKDKSSLLEDITHRIQRDALNTLCELQRRHLAAIPWGNTGLHYSQHQTVSLHPENLYERMVERRLDGYCMENSGLFFVLLRSLGYIVYATGGRVSHAAANGVDNGLFLAFGHMILIVIIDGVKYMVDVGFGNNNATAPLLLREGTRASRIAPGEMRLVRDSIAEFIDKTQKVWIYQVRYNLDSNWLPMICFSDVEFLSQDFDVMNFCVSQNRTSWFTQVVVCTRMVLDEDEREIIGQVVLLGNEVKRRIRGKSEVLEVMSCEQDRVKALGRYFDMHFRGCEIEGIRGLSSELK